MLHTRHFHPGGKWSSFNFKPDGWHKQITTEVKTKRIEIIMAMVIRMTEEADITVRVEYS